MIRYLIFFVLTVMFILAECNAPHEILYLGNEHNGQQIQVSLNQEIVIELEAKPATGYTWTVSDIDTNIIKQIQGFEFKSNSNKIGAPGKQTFRFKAVSVSQTELKLIYHRPWEKEVAPLDSFHVKIDVIK